MPFASVVGPGMQDADAEGLLELVEGTLDEEVPTL